MNNINNEEGNNEILMEPFTKNESKSLKNVKIDKIITKNPIQVLKQGKPWAEKRNELIWSNVNTTK